MDGWIDHSWKESFWWNPAIAIWSAQKSWLGALAGLAVQKQGEGFNKTDWLLWRRGFMRGESKGENERAMALWNLCSISRILKMWVMGSLVQQELKKFWHCPEETKLQNIGHLSLDILVLHTQLTSFDSKMFLSGGKDPTLTCWLNWGWNWGEREIGSFRGRFWVLNRGQIGLYGRKRFRIIRRRFGKRRRDAESGERERERERVMDVQGDAVNCVRWTIGCSIWKSVALCQLKNKHLEYK